MMRWAVGVLLLAVGAYAGLEFPDGVETMAELCAWLTENTVGSTYFPTILKSDFPSEDSWALPTPVALEDIAIPSHDTATCSTGMLPLVEWMRDRLEELNLNVKAGNYPDKLVTWEGKKLSNITRALNAHFFAASAGWMPRPDEEAAGMVLPSTDTDVGEYATDVAATHLYLAFKGPLQDNKCQGRNHVDAGEYMYTSSTSLLRAPKELSNGKKTRFCGSSGHEYNCGRNNPKPSHR